MKIACLAWGSLVWDPRDLKYKKPWFKNGPILPIEFTRQSKDGRLTLAITEYASPVKVLWALMDYEDIKEAKESLKKREEITSKYIDKYIHSVNTKDQITGTEFQQKIQKTVQEWAKTVGVDAVIWTGLPAKFNCKEDIMPKNEDVLEYIRNLKDAYEKTKEYVEKAPSQIKTKFRAEFEKEFGWENKGI